MPKKVKRIITARRPAQPQVTCQNGHRLGTGSDWCDQCHHAQEAILDFLSAAFERTTMYRGE